MSKITFYTVDLAKNVFQLHGYAQGSRPAVTRRLSRPRFAGFFERDAQPGATVVMEACGSAHYWGRWLAARGYEPVLLPPALVRPFVSGNKTDAADAHGLAKAYRCGDLHPVPVKTEDQQAIQYLHRVRQRRIKSRTQVINQLRALLREWGIVCAGGPAALMRALPRLLEADSRLPRPVQTLLADLAEELRALNRGIATLERELATVFRRDATCQRLGEVPGIGVITATALIAAIPDIHRFARGRALAAWLGLTPKEHSSGNTRWLGGITKHGNTYLRTLLVHGARSAASHSRSKTDATSRWVQQLVARRGQNRAVVALANKNARIVWALMAHQTHYQPQ